MARATKKSSAKKAPRKAAKKTTPKKAPKKARGRPRRRVLTPDERAALLTGRTGWLDVVDDVVRAMETTGLRVEGVTRARLTSLAARAVRAAAREEILLEKQRVALEPVQDERRAAVDAGWRALLEVLATVRFKARRDPRLLTEFAALLELMTNELAPAEPAPAPG